MSLGRDPWHGRPRADLTVNDLMRKNIKAIPETAAFDQVIAYIEGSRDNTYPVVNESAHLVGVIRYREMSSALFDPNLGALVRAADVTTPAGWLLCPDDPLSLAYATFQSGTEDCIPVVTRDKPQQLLGIVRRRDVLRHLIRGKQGNGGASH